MTNKKCSKCGEVWYSTIQYCLCGNNKFIDTNEDWKKSIKSICELCENKTDDNYIGGVWVCSRCYLKFKIVFEHYLPFVDENKLLKLLHEKRLEYA